MRAQSSRLFAFALLAVACAKPVTPAKEADPNAKILRILSLTPDVVPPDGSTLVTLAARNGCALPDAALSFDGAPLSTETLRSPGDGVYVFAPPARDVSTRTEFILELRCAKPSDGGAYAVATASAKLVFDPALEAAPTVKLHAPVGDAVPVDAKVIVTFSRAMQPSSISANTIFIDGVEGAASYDETSATATFAPLQPLAAGKPYTVVVKAGEAGVRSAHGRPLATTLAAAGAPAADADRWSFTTACAGCAVPSKVVGDVGSAAGFSRNAKYKLFSITGQAGSPVVGTTGDAQHRLEAGSVPASDVAPR